MVVSLPFPLQSIKIT